jgi:hypothetical protein
MADKFVYVIAAQDGPVKIGFSAHPEKRLKELQTGHAEPLFLHHTEPVAADKAYLIEQLIHADNRHRRLRGEWFRLNVEDAVAEIQFAVIRYSENLPTKRA